MNKFLCLFLALAEALSGPYYLGYDCLDNCCDRVPECGDLPGGLTSTETRDSMLRCLAAVPEGCYITARVGFVAAGFDVYDYRVVGYDNGDFVGSHAFISFEDLFRVFPHFKPDVQGIIHAPNIDSSCDFYMGCIPYGSDNKAPSCIGGSAAGLKDEDRATSLWITELKNLKDTPTKVFGFNAHFLGPTRSHMSLVLDSSFKEVAKCTKAMAGDDGLGIWVSITGLISNIRTEEAIEDTFHLGWPELPTFESISTFH